MRNATPGWRARARVSAAGPSFLRWPAASSTSGTETTSRLPRATSSSMPGVDQRLGELDEAEPDRQLARGLADVLGERPELLEPVGVAAAVADDQQRRASCDRGSTRHEPTPARRRAPRSPARARRRADPGQRRRGRRELQRRHPAVVAAGEHRDVDALAALERADGERAEPRVAARACHSQRGVVAALDAREPHPAQLVGDDLQVAQREAGDRDRAGAAARSRSAPRRISAAGVVQASTPVASTASVALATMPNASHSPSSATNGSTSDEQHERHLDHQPAGEQRGRRAAKTATAAAARRRPRTARPVTARHERDRDDEQQRRQHLALGGSAVQRRLDGRDELLVGAPGSQPAPAAVAPGGRDHGREVGRGAVGRGQRLARCGRAPRRRPARGPRLHRVEHVRQLAPALVDDHCVEAAQCARAARRRRPCTGRARAARSPRRARSPSARRGPASR